MSMPASDAAPPLAPIASGDFGSKLAFLSNAASYPESTTSRVERIETRMSWVFLTDRYAYKLKKPLRTADVDLRTLAARHWNCVEEVRLNRRLAPDVYLDPVALRIASNGELGFAGAGHVVDWLVKMNRLPADRMLDRRIRNGTVSRTDVDALLATLCDFYARCRPLAMPGAEYRRRLRDEMIANGSALAGSRYGPPPALVETLFAAQFQALDDLASLLDARAETGRIVEAHGDLRPEHVCLLPQPRIIDCLEFSRALRTLDAADELGFLALECERLGATELPRLILDGYRERSRDAPPDRLVHFYQSHRACVRARLAVRRLKEPLPAAAGWSLRAQEYLRLARSHIERARDDASMAIRQAN
jgi:aminoglycoside phosphotransferase family enzyme